MKRRGWMRRGAVLCLLGLIPLSGTASAGLQGRPAPPAPQTYDTGAHADANNLDMFVTNEGSFAFDISTGNAGLIFPKGTTKTAVFAAGLWVGATVNGVVQTSLAEYSMTYGPGGINAAGVQADPLDPRFHVYKINAGDTTSTDYTSWPVADGAPVDSLGKPGLIGDQTLWSVCNDLTRSANNSASPTGMGLEVQQTTFIFNRTGALGNVIFLEFKIINKGQHRLENTYVSVWSDPDLGGSADDFVGCDTTLSLGYCYNATNTDNLYGSTPPAVGFDFFKGPKGDNGTILPMTSFNKYINGTDPDSPAKAYFYQQGLAADGTQVIDPTTNRPSKFMHPGDPVAATGWLDSNPADRRMMLSSGPFTMAPGDTQTVVTAVIMGQGKDRLTSVTALKFNDLFAQAAFDAKFLLPSPPPRPVVSSARLDDEIVLYWGDDSERNYHQPGYTFEGYNVYMGESVAGPWKRIFTFDINDNVGIIFDDQFDLNTGVVIFQPVQFGNDGGVKRRVTIDTDYNIGGRLNNGHPYYFSVSAYSYNPNAAAGLRTLENSITPIVLVPQQPEAGVRYLDGTAGDTLAVQRLGGASDGRVLPIVVNPTSITGETYQVTFGADTLGTFWDLKTTGGRNVLLQQRNQSGDEVYLTVDGIFWKVIGALPGFKTNAKGNPMIDEVAAAGGVAVPPDVNGGPGNDVWHSFNSTRDYLLSAGGGDGGVDRLTRAGADFANLDARDIWMRWDYSPDNIGWWNFDNGLAGPVPFSLWLKDATTGDSLQLIPLLTGGGFTEAVYDFPPADEVTDPYSGFPCTDWTYAYTPIPGKTYADFLADFRDNGVIDTDITNNELFARLVVASERAADGSHVPTMPPAGTVIKFSTTKPNQPADKFQIATKGVSFDPVVMKNDLAAIRVVPNPYFAHSAYERNQFERLVKFTRMPPQATVRIFNLAGDLVRTLQKTDLNTSFLNWDLLTDQQLPVGSGVYIYHVEGKDASGRTVGTTNGRVAVFIEKERLNTF